MPRQTYFRAEISRISARSCVGKWEESHRRTRTATCITATTAQHIDNNRDLNSERATIASNDTRLQEANKLRFAAGIAGSRSHRAAASRGPPGIRPGLRGWISSSCSHPVCRRRQRMPSMRSRTRANSWSRMLCFRPAHQRRHRQTRAPEASAPSWLAAAHRGRSCRLQRVAKCGLTRCMCERRG